MGVFSSGAVIVIYGSANGLVASDSGAPASQFWSQNAAGIPGASELGDRFGYALASGDFNDDGFSDLAIGAPGDGVVLSGIGTRGRVVVIYGSPDGLSTNTNVGVLAPQSWAMSKLNNTDGQILFFAAETEADIPGSSFSFGYALAWGDFNGDGVGDLAVGSPEELVNNGDGASVELRNGGAVGILFGSRGGGLSAQSSKIFTARTLTPLERAVAGDRLGSALAAGDFIAGDGITDLAIGIPGSSFPRIFVNGSPTTPANETGAVQMLRGSFRGLIVDSFFSFGERKDQFGSVFAAGDFDGNGHQKLAVGVPLKDSRGLRDSGGVFIVSFDRGSPESIRLFDQSKAFGSGNSEAGDLFGFSLASGKFNADEFADLAIGVPFEDLVIPLRGTTLNVQNAGEVDVIYGTNNGLSVLAGPQRWTQNLPSVGSGEGDLFGWSLSSWNFGKNQFVQTGNQNISILTADLAIGAPFKTVNGAADAGAVSVLYGSHLGLTSTDSQFWTQSSLGIPGGAEQGDWFGSSLH